MKHDREMQIQQMLTEKGRVTIEELCNSFNVSVETVRRDLNALEDQGVLKRVYGGAVSTMKANPPSLMPPWNKRSNFMQAEKQAIARETLKHIEDNSVIALDSGTTTYELCKILGEKNNLTIITNDIRNAYELSSHTSHKIFLIGGMIQSDDIFTSGFMAVNFLDAFAHIDTAILCCDAFSKDKGNCDYNNDMMNIKARIIHKCDRLISVFDHTKFSQNAPFMSFPANRIDLIITDNGLDDKYRNDLIELNVPYVLVDVQ